MLPVLHHLCCFITSCALRSLYDVGWAACAVWWQELSCQEAEATSSLSRGRHGELSHSVVRHKKIIRSRMSRVITLPVLIRQHGSFSSRSSRFLPFLQRQGVVIDGGVLNFGNFIFLQEASISYLTSLV